MTMRTSKTMTVSLPPEMVEEFEAVRKAERRTRSELAREAFRTYFARTKVVQATPAEEKAILRGRAEFARGETVTLTEILNDLETRNHKKRPKVAQKTSR
jgi:predicted transcriptional regulator